jgi:hypothetical protein
LTRKSRQLKPVCDAKPVWAMQRRALETEVGPISPETLVPLMLTSLENWRRISTFAENVLKRKKAEYLDHLWSSLRSISRCRSLFGFTYEAPPGRNSLIGSSKVGISLRRGVLVGASPTQRKVSRYSSLMVH